MACNMRTHTHTRIFLGMPLFLSLYDLVFVALRSANDKVGDVQLQLLRFDEVMCHASVRLPPAAAAATAAAAYVPYKRLCQPSLLACVHVCMCVWLRCRVFACA